MRVCACSHPVHHKAQCGKLARPVADNLLSQDAWEDSLEVPGLKPCEGTTWAPLYITYTIRTVCTSV